MIEFSLRTAIVIILVIIGVTLFLIFIFAFFNPQFGEFFVEICNVMLGPFSKFCEVLARRI